MEQLAGLDIYKLFAHAANYVAKRRQHLNDINVFPVADADTGNNIVATLGCITTIPHSNIPPIRAFEAIANASLLAARGNSGLILSQYINGLAINCPQSDYLTVTDFVAMTKQAAELAYAAIEEPVEGTIITIMKAWAQFCQTIVASCSSFESLFKQSLAKLAPVLEQTSSTLEILKVNRVVDAGAQGFYFLMEGIFDGIRHYNQIQTQTVEKGVLIDIQHEKDTHYFVEAPKYRYCTEAVIQSETQDATKLKQLLQHYGDSVVVSGLKSLYRIHVHTNNPVQLFAKLDAECQYQYPKVDDMQKQFEINKQRKFDIALVTDSAADLPQEFLDQHQIHVVPFNILFRDTTYLDKFTIDPLNFYNKVATASDYPTSSMPDGKTVHAILNALHNNYKHIIFVTISKQMSGSYNLVKHIANDFKKVTVIDSKTSTGAQGLLVMRCAELIAKGYDHETIIATITKEVVNSKILVGVDDIRYLVRSGRVRKFSGMIGRLINVKPIVGTCSDGTAQVVTKSFSLIRSYRKIATLIQEHHQEYPISNYCILHANAVQNLKVFTKIIEDALGKSALYTTEVSPLIGLHAGVGCVAIASYSNS